MKCTNCGSEVPDTAKVCGHCGHRLKAASPSPVTSVAPPPAVAERMTTTGKLTLVSHYMKWAGLFFMGIGAAFLILWITSFILGDGHNVLYLIIPIIIIALMFLAWKQPLIAAILLFIPTCLTNYIFAFLSLPLFLACLLLLASGVLTLIAQRRQEVNLL